MLYYLFPKKYRWLVLLAQSLGFYWKISGRGWIVFLITLLAAYGLGILLERIHNAGKSVKNSNIVLAAAVLLIALPWIVIKNGDFVLGSVLHRRTYPWIVPVGLSFYTLQLISYLTDVGRGRIEAQKNLGKFALFASFFPQIIQGPIPRYEQLGKQLYEGHSFEEKAFVKGWMLVIWGFFLKLMIADKAAVAANTIFGNVNAYQGCYVFVAGALYSVQLYADFLACVSLAQGVSELYGIHLIDNFRHPYHAVSIKDFWGRWHISLSTWLRDYVYIPLGGNRAGRLRKYRNLLITFAVSGIWHGAGYKYIFWGLMHAGYQIAGDVTRPLKNRIYHALGMPEGRLCRVYIQRAGTWFWVMLAWIIFRAESLRAGLFMIRSMVTVYNPWIFFDDSLLRLGLSWKEWMVLLGSIMVLVKISVMQERMCVRDAVLRQPLPVRWVIYIGAILGIMIFGTYGFGFNASDFIYGGF